MGTPRPQLPLAALADDRLTARDLRVLAALCTRDLRRTGRPFTMLRQAISALTGLRETRVSESAARLVATGYLTREGGGGRGAGATYAILWGAETIRAEGMVYQPETVRPGGMVSDPETVRAEGVVSGSVVETVRPGGMVSEETLRAEGMVLSPPLRIPPSSSNQIIPRLEHRSSIRSDSDARDNSGPGEGASESQRVFDWLQAAQMPMHYLHNAEDLARVRSWVVEFPLEQIKLAIDRAVKARRSQRDPRPIGPRYVDTILRNLIPDHRADDGVTRYEDLELHPEGGRHL